MPPNTAPLDLYHLPGFHDPFSAISHLLGAVAFIPLGYLLLRRGRGDRTRMIYLSIYAAACVFLFSMSAVYHMMVREGIARNVMGRLDHCAIFVLIAGPFTPCYGILEHGWRRWAPLLFVWTVAITGITLKATLYTNIPEWLGLSLYLGLGWFGGISAIVLCRRYGLAFIEPLLFGGLAYSIGAVLDYFKWPILVPGIVHTHELFHLFVLVGAGFHYWFVWEIATGHSLDGHLIQPAPLDEV